MKKKEQSEGPIEFETKFREVCINFKNKSKTTSEFVYNCYRDLLEIRPGKSLKYPVRLEKYIIERKNDDTH